MGDKVTAPSVRAAKGGAPLKMITAYDAPTARIADAAGADIILVGDSLANVVLGYDTTLEVTLDVMLHHTAAVARARPRALLVGDMPWLSYHISVEETVRNVGRMIQEGGAEAVKIEGGRERVPVARAILDAEVPVMGHLGLTPQSVHVMGGYRVQGRDTEMAEELVEDARALAEAGVFSIVLEGVPDVLAEVVTREIPVPTIGIGAGNGTDGQVLVFHDLVGMHQNRLAKFVKSYANLFDEAVAAVETYFAEVVSREFPGPEQTYAMPEEAAAALLERYPPSAG